MDYFLFQHLFTLPHRHLLSYLPSWYWLDRGSNTQQQHALRLSFEIQIFAEPHESWNLLSQFFNIRNFFSRQSSLRNTGSSIVVDWKREMLNWNFLAWIFDPFDPVVKPLNAWMFTKKSLEKLLSVSSDYCFWLNTWSNRNQSSTSKCKALRYKCDQIRRNFTNLAKIWNIFGNLLTAHWVISWNILLAIWEILWLLGKCLKWPNNDEIIYLSGHTVRYK